MAREAGQLRLLHQMSRFLLQGALNVDQVLYTVHEIRNPLVTIGGFARSLLRAPDDVSRVRRNAQIITDEVQRLEALLTGMLDLAHPPALVFRPENLHDLLDQAWLLTVGEAQSVHPIELRKNYDAQLPLTPVDSRSLLRAFLNVMRNAVQAMPEGGVVTLTTRSLGQQVLVSLSTPPFRVTKTVS